MKTKVQQDIESKEPSQLTAQDLRNLYNNILTRTDDANRNIGAKIKLIDMGETQREIQQAMVTISRVTRKESKMGSLLAKFVPEGMYNKLYDKAAEEAVAGKTVLEVSTTLIESINTRRERVEVIFADLVKLHDSIVHAHNELEAVIEGINENMDKFDQVERVKMVALKSEMLQTRELHRDNLITAQGAIQTAENAVLKYSEMLPAIRAQINDGLSIRGALKELENLTTVCEGVTELCNIVREENRKVMTEQLLTTLEKTVISDKQVQYLAHNQSEQAKLHKDIQNALKRVNERREKVVHELERIGNGTDIRIGLINKDAK